MTTAEQTHKTVDEHNGNRKAFIGGAWVESDTGARFPVVNPFDATVVGHVPMMGAAETRRSIEGAHEAFLAWRKRTVKERADILLRWHDLVLADTERLARLMTLEQGKTLADARTEIAYAASFLRFYAEEGRRTLGEIIPSHRQDTRILVTKEPIGVVGCITPWNFPAAMITRKAAPALAAGCTVVMKPAESTPLSALALAELAEAAGVPAGVFNVITGSPTEIGAELCAHPLVRKLSFTGSTRVGKLLAAACASTVKKLALELGGNAPFIVFDDADLDAAVAGATLAKFRHSGQTCVTPNRFLVQSGVYDAFVERFAARAAALKAGNGLLPESDIGPLINEAALRKVREHLEDAVGLGARVAAGGGDHPQGGTFFQPTVLRDVDASMLLMREETFGPLAGVVKFETEDEAVQIANDTPYGLAAYFYTPDVSRIFRVSERLESGMVGVNSAFLSVEIAPFGGVKESGLGREGSHHGIDEFLELKYVSLGNLAV